MCLTNFLCKLHNNIGLYIYCSTYHKKTLQLYYAIQKLYYDFTLYLWCIRKLKHIICDKECKKRGLILDKSSFLSELSYYYFYNSLFTFFKYNITLIKCRFFDCCLNISNLDVINNNASLFYKRSCFSLRRTNT